MDLEDQKPPPSKAGKLAAVAGFFLVLFFLASLIGLPLPLSVVSFFFLTVAAPGAFIFALGTALVFKLVARAAGKPGAWPFFDVALQTFILASLISTGVFVVRFPGWLENFYPSIRQEIEGQIASDVPVEDRLAFIDALDRFWAWNVSYLLEPTAPPSEIDQQRVQEAVQYFRDAVQPACEECGPELTGEEVVKLTGLMNGVTLGRDAEQAGQQPAIPVRPAPGPISAPEEATAGTTETSASPGGEAAAPATEPTRP